MGTEVASLYTHDGVVKCASAGGAFEFRRSAVLVRMRLIDKYFSKEVVRRANLTKLSFSRVASK